MDLLSATSGAIDAINPRVPMTIQVSTGSNPSADGTPVPTYASPVSVIGEIQPLTFRDLKQVDGLNLSGSLKAIYLEGHFNGIVRPKMKGGDLITDNHSNVWLVTQVLEYWPDWVKVCVVLQLDGN